MVQVALDPDGIVVRQPYDGRRPGTLDGLQLRIYGAKIVCSVLAVDQQPVKADACTQFRGHR